MNHKAPAIPNPTIGQLSPGMMCAFPAHRAHGTKVGASGGIIQDINLHYDHAIVLVFVGGSLEQSLCIPAQNMSVAWAILHEDDTPFTLKETTTLARGLHIAMDRATRK